MQLSSTGICGRSARGAHLDSAIGPRPSSGATGCSAEGGGLDYFGNRAPGDVAAYQDGRAPVLRRRARSGDWFQPLTMVVGLLCSASVLMSRAGGVPTVSNFPQPGEWPSDRRDGSLAARSPAKGQILEPKVVWKQFIGKTDTLLVVSRDREGTKLDLPAAGTTNGLGAAGDPRWSLTPSVKFAEVKLGLTRRSSTTTSAEVFTEGKGLEKFEFESGFSKPTVNGQWQSALGRCFLWKNEAWTKVWESEEIKELFQPLPLVGDFDGDGKLEVAILPWKQLLILDAESGRVKDRCAFTPGRSYGFFGVYDLAGDGKKEFVVQADFAKHVDVLGYRDGRLGLLWQRELELDISNPKTILNVIHDPVGDVDGDGKLEVLVNAYNVSGDRRWHLAIHDGMTGIVKADLIDECLQSLVDLDGDGVCELLTIHAEQGWIPSRGTIQLHSIRGGKHQILWQRENAAWEDCHSPQPLNVNSAAIRPDRDVLHRRVHNQMQLIVREQARKGGNTLLTKAIWSDGRFKFTTTITGRELKALGIDADGNLLVRTTTAPERRETIVVKSGVARAIASQARGVVPGVATVVLGKGQSSPTITAQGLDELVSFQAPRNTPGIDLRRLPGRGQDGHGPILADLLGDGSRQMVYVTDSPNGGSRLVVSDLVGRKLWHHDFVSIPGGPVVWNVGTTVLWQVGHFTNRRGQDILVTNRRSMMHSEETLLLSGKEGHELWHRDREISGRGVGGTPFAIADYDGDGLEDLASFYPSIFYMLKGSTGKDIKAMDATWEKVPAKPVYWGLPIALHFEGQDQPGIFFAGTSMTGLVHPDGTLVWWDALDKSPRCLPAFGDFAGEGRIEAVGVGYEDGIRCYDAAKGSVRWRMPAPEPGVPTGTASADINSCGRDEALVVIGSTLYCFGEDKGGQGLLLWKLSFPTAIGPPSIADVDNSGVASILVVGADGNVYCVR